MTQLKTNRNSSIFQIYGFTFLISCSSQSPLNETEAAILHNLNISISEIYF